MSFSGGVFSINTTGQPVVSGTTISASVFNALTADLATGLSTCMLKDGTQTATAGIGFYAGTVSLPGIYLGTDTSTGFYRIGLNNNGYAVGGAKVLDIASTGLSVTGTLSATNNVNADQSFTLTNATAGTASAVRLDLVSDSAAGQLTLSANSSLTAGAVFGVTAAKLKTVFDNSSTANSNGLLVGTAANVPLYLASNAAVIATVSATGVAISGTLNASDTINANGGTIATTQTTANLLNATATTVNFAGAASTALNIGHASGTAAFAGKLTTADRAAIAGSTITNGVLYVAGTGGTATQNSLVLGTSYTSAATTAAIGMHVSGNHDGGAYTTTTDYGIYVGGFQSAGGGHTVTTQYGLYIAELTLAGTNVAIKTNGTNPVQFGGTVTTGAPSGGAGAWKLGVANSVSPTSPDRTITVDINGTTYYIAAKTTND